MKTLPTLNPLPSPCLVRKRMGWLLSSALLLSLSACSSNDNKNADIQDDAAPMRFEVAADPNGIWWDEADQQLYVTDNESNQILELAEDGSLSPYAVLTQHQSLVPM